MSTVSYDVLCSEYADRPNPDWNVRIFTLELMPTSKVRVLPTGTACDACTRPLDECNLAGHISATVADSTREYTFSQWLLMVGHTSSTMILSSKHLSIDITFRLCV